MKGKDDETDSDEEMYNSNLNLNHTTDNGFGNTVEFDNISGYIEDTAGESEKNVV